MRYRIILIFFVLWSFCSLCSCDIDDRRDFCCGRNNILITYHMGNREFLEKVADHIDYYLFDSVGNYMHKMKPLRNNMRRVCLESLPAGKYTMVAIANLDQYGKLKGHSSEGLRQFKLVVGNFLGDTDVFGNGEPLYWGQSDFRILEKQKKTYTLEMNHIHCRLRLRVEWERLPDYADGFEFGLEGIGQATPLYGGQNDILIYHHRYPPVTSYDGRMRLSVPLRRMVLEEELFTLRYTDSHIPIFHLYNGRKDLTGPIDLSRAFMQWGWKPDQSPEQEYSILIKIRADGKIELHPGLGTSVNDWIDGGVIGI